EGVTINYLVAPQKIIGSGGRVSAIQCERMQLGEPDESGRRRPVPIPGSEFTLEVDAVVPAIGQSIDLSLLPPERGFAVSRRGTLEVDPLTLATGIDGVFAGGDMSTGPATVVQAVGAGREAAISIARYLQGLDLREGREHKLPVVEIEPGDVQKDPRRRPPLRSPSERMGDFNEVQQGFSEADAVAEARRCLSCGICSECLQCV
ncbi:MAG: FAD-dependent oxidoreductase, partial [Bradyrhizobium sp.]|nr:FAD-dependent oxidoreductase [Bradyrhizobium sp.]